MSHDNRPFGEQFAEARMQRLAKAASPKRKAAPMPQANEVSGTHSAALPDVEPVAWRCATKSITGLHWTLTREKAIAENWLERGFTVEPLFTHPASEGPGPSNDELWTALRSWLESRGLYDQDDREHGLTVEQIIDRLPASEGCPKGNDQFNTGYVIACANIVNLHDEPTIAADVIAEAGVTWPQVLAMNLTDYDMKALREIRNQGRKSPFADGRKKLPPAPSIPEGE